jgi:hypothetical protein
MNVDFDTIVQRLDRIEASINSLLGARTSKEWYTTAEVARLLGRRPFTVREWCRLQRVHAQKSQGGRGIDAEWRISHAELTRIQNEGLLPFPTKY